MKSKELQELTKEELDKKLGENKARLIQLRFDVSARQHKNHQDIKATKKNIAQIMTRLNQIEKEKDLTKK